MTHGNANGFTVIRCWPADGDRVKFFPTKSAASGVATLSVAYNIGHDFDSCPIAERKRRVLNLYKLLQSALDEALHDIEAEFRGHARLIEAPKPLTGNGLRKRLSEIDRKHGKQSPVVSGGLPSLGKRQ